MHRSTKDRAGHALVVCALLAVTSTSARAQDGISLLPAPARLHRPAWVVGDVPNAAWTLVERAVAEGDPDEAKATLIEAEASARAALVGHEDDVDRRFIVAAVLGMRAELEGGRTKVGLASELYGELEAILARAPDHVGARYAMGRLHAAACRMSGTTRWLAVHILGGDRLKGTSWAQAEDLLTYAEHHAPAVPDHHLQLARLYLDTGRPDAALAEARHVLTLAASAPTEMVAALEAERLVAELEGR